MPTSGDEKTKVISVTPSPAGRPVGPAPGTATPNSSNPGLKQTPPKSSPFASYFNDGNSKVKRTILAGAIGGGLLVSFLALTSFKKADEEETPTDGSTGSGTTTPEVSEGEVVSINTGHEVYTGLHDDLSLDEVRDIARENVGAQGLFMYKDEVHPAMTNDEWNNQTSEQALDYINKVNVIPPSEDDVVTLPIDINGETKDLKLDPLHKADLIQIGTDDSGRVFVIPQGRSASELQNIAVGENGVYYRTDPVTGELKVFTIEEILTQIDQKGTVEVEVIVPGIEEPVIDGTYMYGYVDNAYSDAGIMPGEAAVSGYGWGWDTDGDDDIDIYDDDYPVTSEPDPYWLPDDSSGDPAVITTIPEYVEPVAKTDRELLDERIAEMARESGMDPKEN